MRNAVWDSESIKCSKAQHSLENLEGPIFTVICILKDLIASDMLLHHRFLRHQQQPNVRFSFSEEEDVKVRKTWSIGLSTNPRFCPALVSNVTSYPCRMQDAEILPSLEELKEHHISSSKLSRRGPARVLIVRRPGANLVPAEYAVAAIVQGRRSRRISCCSTRTLTTLPCNSASDPSPLMKLATPQAFSHLLERSPRPSCKFSLFEADRWLSCFIEVQVSEANVRAERTMESRRWVWKIFLFSSTSGTLFKAPPLVRFIL